MKKLAIAAGMLAILTVSITTPHLQVAVARSMPQAQASTPGPSSSMDSIVIRAANQAVAVHIWNEAAWYAGVARAKAAREAAAKVRTQGHAAGPARYGTGACGGSLPPCWVMMRESHGNLDAYNPTGCSGRGCYGKWQCDPRSCNGHGTEAEQDAEAARLWDNGRGCGNWAAC